jgi:hypothetical protein
LIPADKTGARPAQPSEGPRCPDCGALDPCEHDAAGEGLYVALLILAGLGALFVVLLVLLVLLVLVRWIS